MIIRCDKNTSRQTTRYSEITPEDTYLSRRHFMLGAGAVLTSTALACTPGLALTLGREPSPTGNDRHNELDNTIPPYTEVTSYSDYNAFSVGKTAAAVRSREFKPSPDAIVIGGLVRNPKAYTVDEMLGKFTQEERIYRLRSVEGLAMIIPWIGFSLASLLREAAPLPGARFVRFETATSPGILGNQRRPSCSRPCVEGLRLDEAMHDLTILATGIYGRPLPPQDGLPIRLVVPWKYGFKSVRSIVRIDLVKNMPTTFWMAAAPQEYGFYANVNPAVNHPRWSQASEKRVGELFRSRRTLMFNGYGEQVARMYKGMDLRRYF